VEPSNAIVSINLHGGKGIPGVTSTDWRIQGEKGWLRLTSPSLFLNVGSPDAKLELYDTANDKVQELVPDKDEWSELPLPAQNIARLFEAYRKGEWYPDFEHAVKMHGNVEKLWKDFDESEANFKS
jgi:predicted dehydrogenase